MEIQDFKKNTILGVILFGTALTKLADIIIIVTCCKRKTNHRPRFYIIGSISFADLIYIIAVDIVLIFGIIRGKVERGLLLNIPATILVASHLTSIDLILFLSIERFIAVKFCLRNHEIVTERKVTFGIGACWFVSLLIATMLRISVENRYKFMFRSVITTTIFRVMVAVSLIICSVYTNIIRKRHVKDIEARNNHFGIFQEELDKLNKLRRSIKNTFKLNIAVTATLLIESIFELRRSFQFNENLLSVNIPAVIIIFLLKISSVLAIVFTQEILRKELKKVFCFWKRSVSPNVITEQPSVSQTAE